MTRQTVATSTIVGAHVENWEGETLGTITDVVIDKIDGEVEYLVLSPAGDFGLLNPKRRFAVPFTAAARKRTRDGEFEYLIDIDLAKMEQCPGFDEDNPPDFADECFTQSLNDFYAGAHLDIRV